MEELGAEYAGARVGALDPAWYVGARTAAEGAALNCPARAANSAGAMPEEVDSRGACVCACAAPYVGAEYVRGSTPTNRGAVTTAVGSCAGIVCTEPGCERTAAPDVTDWFAAAATPCGGLYLGATATGACSTESSGERVRTEPLAPRSARVFIAVGLGVGGCAPTLTAVAGVASS